MTDEQQFDHTVPGRVAKLETDTASMRSDIRGIFAGLDEIRDVLVRMQESARPNLGGLFLILLGTCTFLVTIGGLTMAPVQRDIARLQSQVAEMQAHQLTLMENRFDENDGRRLEDMVDETQKQLIYLYGRAGMDYPK